MATKKINLQEVDLENVFYAFSDSFLYNLLYMGVYQEMPTPFYHHHIMDILEMLVNLPLKNKKKYIHALFQYIESEEEAKEKIHHMLNGYFRDSDETDAYLRYRSMPKASQNPDAERLGKGVWILKRYFTVFAAYNIIIPDSDTFWNLCCRLFMNKEELCIPYSTNKIDDFDDYYSLESLKERAKRYRQMKIKLLKNHLKLLQAGPLSKSRREKIELFQKKLERLKRGIKS